MYFFTIEEIVNFIKAGTSSVECNQAIQRQVLRQKGCKSIIKVTWI